MNVVPRLLFAQFTSDIKPPIAHEDRLTELRSIRAQERRLSSINIAIVPTLASRFRVSIEAGIRLLVAIEIRVRYCPQDRIVSSGTAGDRFSQFQIFDNGRTQKAGGHIIRV